MTDTMSTYAYGLKEWYAVPRMIDLTHLDNTAFALIKKVEKFEGSGIPISLMHTNPQGVGATFAQAQARSLLTNSSGVRPILTPVQDYSVAVLDGALIRRTKTDMGAFLKGATPVIDGSINALKCSISQKLFRSGYGSLGVVGSSTGSTITLATLSDAVNFAIGQEIVVSSTEASATLRVITGTQAVTGVDTSTGIITFNQAVSNIASLTNGDFIFRKSDRQDSATPSRIAMAGFEAWCPLTTPAAAESFFGIDRSVYPSRLAGQRKDMTGAPLEEVLSQVCILPGVEGGRVDHAFMNFTRWGQLQTALMARNQLDMANVKATPRIGFPAIQVVGPGGMVKVLADANCPNARVFGCKLSALTIYTSGPAVQVLDEDGLTLRAISNADAYEIRHLFEGNLACDEPRSLVTVAV